MVISPLVALMADLVTAMRRQGITCATTINSLVSMPERAEPLAHIRLGDAGIVLVAPEQLELKVQFGPLRIDGTRRDRRLHPLRA